jgi:hypothetical protein
MEFQCCCIFCFLVTGSGGKTRTQWVWTWMLICHSNRLWVRVQVTLDISDVDLDSVKPAPVAIHRHKVFFFRKTIGTKFVSSKIMFLYGGKKKIYFQFLIKVAKFNSYWINIEIRHRSLVHT